MRHNSQKLSDSDQSRTLLKLAYRVTKGILEILRNNESKLSFLWSYRPLFVKWKTKIDGLEERERMIEEEVGGKDMKRHNNRISGNDWTDNDEEFIGNDLESKESEKRNGIWI